MRPHVGWMDGNSIEATLANPFHRAPVWELGRGVPQLRLDAAAMAAAPPAFAMLLTGVHGCGTEATAALVTARAVEQRWRPVVVPVAPFRPLLGQVCDAIDAAADAHDATAATDVADRIRPITAGLRERRRFDGAVGDALLALVRELSEAGWGVFVCVEHLHAASAPESEVLLSTLAELSEATGALRTVATATSAHAVGTERATRTAWIDVPLAATREQVAQVLGEARRVGRTFNADAVEVVHRYCGGVAEIALTHAAVTFDMTCTEELTARDVEQTARRAETMWTARLHERWAGRLSLGQRRYLQALHAAAGAEWAVVDQVHDGLCRGGTRFAPSTAALDATLDALVREGLVMVQDGYVRVAVRGLAAIL